MPDVEQAYRERWSPEARARRQAGLGAEAKPPTGGQYGDIIDKHAQRVGIDSGWIRRIMQIESGGRSYETTGRYKGLLQLDDKEFKRFGGTGSPYDPEQNIMAGANKLAQDRLTFKAKYNREPSLGELYMIHQQGEGGAAAHYAHPDQPAWVSMASTAEGKAKGEAWAKKAIWGNIPDNLKAQFGSVENVKSSDLTGIYTAKLEGKGTVTASEWAGHRKAMAKGTDEPGLLGRGETMGPEPKKPEPDFTPGFEPARVVHADVEAPSISMGRPVVAPRIAGAGRVPQ